MNIWVAASDGDVAVVEKYLNSGNGLTANSKDPNGYTPVHAAAAYGHIGLLEKLCKEYGGDINVRDSDGDTPLHHVEDANTARFIVEELNGDYKLTNEEGKTALEVFEEDSEFPELIQYMRVKMGVPAEQDSVLGGVDGEQLQQFKESIRYTLENDPVDENDTEALERRKVLERIIQGENAEQELENYIRELVRSQMFEDNSESNKRRK
ncbi:hypothetical protein Kpol_1028p58 [Vanderwaltozyma polyspora DSM 70294]|uniref:Uncharacterized protein n=1 Tax=Vanderwaltozyma polyspora (strain ATCC 22028 / DSM 70294 / BCRC 21397 / CBS 2163 / NBRC 10782 / NRRL Y-8283 / UCD 57-17) TaxID=436907 RepID=A7TG26_VANPO|nr:uncharacterized protein Kpol_1028p58 [Vanderwaltozyma polyspora DSM 70294]EDO18783.1 hypothetical protein Kpol_1028p58 [Vanderwaltozyma polyspora DSM 70294]